MGIDHAGTVKAQKHNGGRGGRRSKCKPKASTGMTKWRNYMHIAFPLVYRHYTTCIL